MASPAAQLTAPTTPVASQGGQAVISEKHGEHTFDKVILVHPSSKASCEIYLHGATVTSWKVMGSELLYLSPAAVFAPGKAIRGGIPVVFPQFGPGVLPQHGFARNSTWALGETSVVKGSGDISQSFTLEDNPTTRAVWPMHFKLTLTVLLKPTAISMQLRVQNLNSDGRPFSFTSLLHTYLGVEDISRTTIRGLQNRTFVDQLDEGVLEAESSPMVNFDCGEVDRIYIDGGLSSVSVNDGGNCELVLKTTNFKDFVVWNPHVAKTAKMADMPADDWKKFVCVEAGAINEPVTLQAGKTWEAAQGISIQMIPDSDVARMAAERATQRAIGQQQQGKL
jgi:glucose-6-phosphate 1-epimerase